MIVLYHNFKDVNDLGYTIEIYDDAIGGESSAVAFATRRGSIDLTTDGDPKDPFKRILTSQLTFDLLLNHKQYTAPSKAAILAFYDNLISSPEGSYYVKLQRTGGEVMFVGKIIADLGDLKMEHHQFVKITAHDGLKGLETIEFRPIGYDATAGVTLTELISIKDFFVQILRKNDVAKFFYQSLLDIPMMSIAAGWTESHATTQPVWFDIYMRNHYYTEVSPTYRRYESAMTVLIDLLNGFNCRLYYSRGQWHIEQLGIQDRLTPTRHTLDWNGDIVLTIPNKIQRNVDNGTVKLLTTPAIGYIAPLKAVALKQNKQYYNILAGMEIYYKPTGSDNRGPHNLGYQIGTGSPLVHDIYFDFDLSAPFSAPAYMVVIELQIKMDTFYLKSTYFDPLTGASYAAPLDIQILTNTPAQFMPYEAFRDLTYEWSPSSATVKYGILVAPGGLNAASAWGAGPLLQAFKNFGITGASIEIVNDGDFELEIVSVNVISQPGYTNIPSETAKINKVTLLKKSRFIIAPNGIQGLVEVPDNTIIYEIGDTKNTIIYDNTMTFFDAGDQWSTRQLFAKDGTDTYTTVEWTDTDMGETLPIQQLCMAQMLSMRSKYGKVIKCSLMNLYGAMHMLDRYNIGDKLHIPVTWSHNVDSGIYKTDLWEVYKDFPGVNILKYEPDPNSEPQYPTDIGIAGAPARLGIEYWEEWEDVALPYVVMTGYNSDLIDTDNEYQVKSKWLLYINGVKQKYVLPDTTTLANRQWTFDETEPDRLRVFKAREAISHIEVYKFF